jgi:hypothetical protein
MSPLLPRLILHPLTYRGCPEIDYALLIDAARQRQVPV